MKKFLVVLLAFVMVFSFASCKEEFNKESALEPSESGSTEKLYDNGLKQEFDLHQVVKTDENANEILDLAYECLEENKIEANITSLYSVPFGISSNDVSILVIRIDYENDEDKLYMVLLSDSVGTDYIGCLKTSEVSDGKFFSMTLDIKESYEKELNEKFDFSGENVEVKFDITPLRGLSFTTPTEDQINLWKNTSNVFYNVNLCNWYFGDAEEEYIDDYMYYHVRNSQVQSLEALKAYIASAFNEANTEAIYKEVLNDTYDDPKYKEQNGKLYCIAYGIGGRMDIEDIAPKAVAIDGDKLYMIIEIKTMQWDNNYENILSRGAEEWLWVYEKSGDSWLCSDFVDYQFGLYRTN